MRKQHELGLDQAKHRIDSVAGQLHDRYGVVTKWHGDDLRVSGNGIRGHIAVSEQSVEVDLRLGFSLLLLEGQIRSGIESALDDHLS